MSQNSPQISVATLIPLREETFRVNLLIDLRRHCARILLLRNRATFSAMHPAALYGTFVNWISKQKETCINSLSNPISTLYNCRLY